MIFVYTIWTRRFHRLFWIESIRKIQRDGGRQQNALKQIEEKRYDADLVEDGYAETIRYGIAFFKKNCRVAMERKILDE